MNDDGSSSAGAIPASISRTALDSLHAKLSAIDCGWLDGGRGGTRDDDGNDCDDCDDGDDGDDGDGDCDVGQDRDRDRDRDRREGDDASIVGPVRTYCRILRRIGDGAEEGGGAVGGRPRRRRRRRQTPLVNAFYAARVAVVTHVLERWIDLAVVAAAAAAVGGEGARGGSDDGASSRRGIVNVVVLGCGMDACGIWSARLSRGRRSGARVYEFDSRENCDSRRRALVGSGLLIESSPPPSRCAGGRRVDDDGVYDGGEDPGCHPPPTSTPFRVVSRGRIVVEDDGGCEDDRNDVDDDYFLVSLDLRGSCPLPPPGDDGGGGGGGDRRESVLSRALRDVGFDSSRPTFVLSELVLSYLGRDGADAVMRAIAEDALGGNGHSMFACLEPMFPPDDDAGGGGDGGGRARTVSVEGSYSVDYGRQFLGKLRRGESRRRAARGADANADAVDPSSSWLHPLGRDPGGARLRLEGCGFPPSGVCHATLGRAASVVAGVRRTAPVGGAPGFLRAKEPFDEHAALALNLGCYVIACVFSSSAGPDPPSTDATADVEGAVAGRRREIFQICPWWEPEDRGVIGPSSAFRIRPISSAREDGRVRELYGRLYAHLYDAHPAIRRMVRSAMRRDLGLDESNVADLRSAVRDRFRLRGGDFWIATDADQRRLVGFIGIGPREERVADEIGPISSPSVVVGYEIHRLAVDECYRGMGVGTSLLSMAEEWARGQQSRSKSGTNVSVKLRAITPDCMTAANKLYESFAYAREETFQAGSIPMNVYCKSLHL